MAPRTPATSAEILALLEQYLADRSAIAAHLNDFYRYAQVKLATTGQRARQWVNDAATEQGAPVRILDISYGSFSRTMIAAGTGRTARWEWTRWDGFDSIAMDAYPHLNVHGRLTDNRDAYAPDNTDFILPAKTLDALLSRAAERTTEIRNQREIDQLAELDAAEDAHGEGIALLRGLLNAANIPRREPYFRVSHNERFAHANPEVDMSTSVKIDLNGAAIDALAAVLKELGVKPRRRQKPGNAGAESKRVPVKADAAAE